MREQVGAFVLVIALAVGTAYFVGFNPFQEIASALTPDKAPTTTSSAIGQTI
jgi:hypothetical protein